MSSAVRSDTCDIWWFGRWEHAPCGASGENDWPDESTPRADYVCEYGEEDLTWSGEWSCDDCGASGDDLFTDGSSTHSHHYCTTDSEDSQ